MQAVHWPRYGGQWHGWKAWREQRRVRAKAARNKTEPPRYDLTQPQHRALKIATVIAVLAGVWLVANFFVTIVLALVTAFLFMPLYRWLTGRLRREGLAAGLTLLLATIGVFIPLAVAVVITISQVEQLLGQLPQLDSGPLSLAALGDGALRGINEVLGSITQGSVQITDDQLREGVTKVTQATASFLLGVLAGSFSGIAGFVTQAIIFIALFIAILTHADELRAAVRTLNPIGDKVSTLYLSRLGAMTKGIVRGQIIIAVCQGVAGALFLYIAGVDYFFFLAMVLSFLNLIPLGGGILSIPIGIVLVLFGNVWQGLFVILTHLLIVTNIDNVLRPRLVPQTAHLNPALMLLAVFGGLGLFGFPGIILGPMIMVLVVSTVEVYLAVNKPATA